MKFISGLCSVPFVYVPLFMQVSKCFDYCTFILCFEILNCKNSLNNLFFCKIALAIWELLRFHEDFTVVFYSCKKMPSGFQQELR